MTYGNRLSLFPSFYEIYYPTHLPTSHSTLSNERDLKHYERGISRHLFPRYLPPRLQLSQGPSEFITEDQSNEPFQSIYEIHNTESFIYYARQQTALACGLAWPARRFTGRQTAAARKKKTLCFLVQFPSNCHAHRRTFAKRRRQGLLIVIIVRHQCCKCSYCDYCDL